MAFDEMEKSIQSIDEMIGRYRELVFDHSFPLVREWKSNHPGGKAVGCFPVYSPVEIIHAAGMLPVAVVGGGNQIDITHADSRFQSFVCSIVKSTMELGLTQQLHCLEGILFQNICDAARNLASVFHRNFPGMLVEYLHFPQNLETPSAENYLTAEFFRTMERLAGLAGRPVSEEDILHSIHQYNQIRSLLRSLDHFRARSPHLLSAGELYVITRAATQLSPEDSLPILSSALDSLRCRDARPKDRVKVLIQGAFCELPPLELIEGLEESGCYVMSDDFLLGWRWFRKDVPLEEEPLRALARSFIDRSVYSSVKHDTRMSKVSHLLEKIDATGAEGIIILVAKFCEPALFDYPLFRRALEEADIPHLFLEFEEKMWVFDQARTEVETFVESILLD